MHASIIICTCNRVDELRKTLESLSKVDVPHGWSVEAVLVDNASKDETPSVLAEAPRLLPKIEVRTTHEAKRGLSAARNHGLRMASGEAIVFTDDDVRLPQDWLTGMAEPILSRAADALAGGVRIAPHLLRPWMTEQHRGWLASTEQLDRVRPISMVGANMSFTRRILEHVPAYDEELGAGALGFGEETTFCRQFKKAGFKISPRFEVEVEHHFQENRLLRSSFVDMAVKRGVSEAYMDYHYDHKPTDDLRRRHLVNVAALRLAQMNPFRFRREGIGLFEMRALIRYHHTKELLRIVGQPRKYEKQGLVKLAQPVHK